ncbi:MAG TPA: cupin domain-containing protein [Gemmatimonadaceae bacterium]|jgi:quercetin dioxygenase-like cupin family protein|nr:cupin domain-containing protein [Gemmatimonadaceae bacterium]
MSVPEERRRPHPADRFAGSEHVYDLPEALRALRAERGPSANKHRQIALAHHGPVRLVLFAFDAGGRLPKHRAPGWVTIHVLRGTLTVRTPAEAHELRDGSLLTLAPGVPHDVDASVEADMLLGIYPDVPPGSGAAAAS